MVDLLNNQDKLMELYEDKVEPLIKGGPGSGNWGHTGRPGKRGGSGTGGGLVNNPKALGRYRAGGGQNTKKHVELIRKATSLEQRNPKRANQGKEDYSISNARYAKGKMLVKTSDGTGFKTTVARLTESLGGKFSNREKGYVLSASRVGVLKELLKDGNWTGTIFGDIARQPNPNDFKGAVVSNHNGPNPASPFDLHPSPPQTINVGFKKQSFKLNENGSDWANKYGNGEREVYKKGNMVITESDNYHSNPFEVYGENGLYVGRAPTMKGAKFLSDVYNRVSGIGSFRSKADLSDRDVADLRQAASVALTVSQNKYGQTNPYGSVGMSPGFDHFGDEIVPIGVVDSYGMTK